MPGRALRPRGMRPRAGECGQLRAGVAPALQPRARSQRDPGRVQCVWLPALPPGDRAGHDHAAGDCGGVELVVEADAGFVERRAHPGDAERVRVWEPISTAARAAANATGVTLVDAPVLASGRLELRWYLREQTISRVLHRYGNVMEPVATE